MSGVRKDRLIREAGDWKVVPAGTTITVRSFKELVVHGFLDVQGDGYVDLLPDSWLSVVALTDPPSVALLGWRWTFSTTTTDADPGAGAFRLNNAAQGSATEAFMNAASTVGADGQAVFDLLDAGARVYAQQVDDSTRWKQWAIGAPTVSAAGYSKLQITEDAAGDDFEDGATVEFLVFTQAGGGGGGGGLADTTDDQEVQTTDATPAVLATYITLADERAITLRALVWVREPTTDASAKFLIEAEFNRAAGGPGTVTELDTVFLINRSDFTTAAVTLAVVGQDIQLIFTGEAGKTLEARGQLEVSEHG